MTDPADRKNGKQVVTTDVGFELVYNDFINAMAELDFRLKPSEAGRYAGHDVYLRKSLTVNPEVKIWRNLDDCGEMERELYVKMLRKAKDRIQKGEDDYYCEMVEKKIYEVFLFKPQDKKSPVYGYACNKMNGNVALSRSITGREAFKQIPRKDWFPKLAGLHPYDLLSLFPKPEAKAMLMLLGRTVCGVGGTVIDDTMISHKMRVAGIVVGLEAGLGKSTLLEYIRASLTELGFTSTSMSASMKFGMGRVANSDLAFRDDLTLKQQQDMLCSNELKTVITGGTLKVEEKGARSYDCDAKATIIAMTNRYSINQFYDMDSGSISRYHFLYTYSQRELSKVYPDSDGRTLSRWCQLADKYSCSELDLGCYLLACAADFFLDVTGYILEDGQLKHKGEDKTQELFEKLTQQYFYKPYVSHVEKLVESIAHLTSFAIAYTARDDDELKSYLIAKGESSSFSFELLSAAINNYAKSTTNEPYDLLDLNSSCRLSISYKMDELKNARRNKNVGSAFEQLTRELVHKDSTTYPTTFFHYTQYWNKIRVRIRKMVAGYESQSFKPVAKNQSLRDSLVQISDSLRAQPKD